MDNNMESESEVETGADTEKCVCPKCGHEFEQPEAENEDAVAEDLHGTEDDGEGDDNPKNPKALLRAAMKAGRSK